MKKLCLAIGCLTLMQTSAFSLVFNNDLKDSGASVSAVEMVDRKFKAPIGSPVIYQPDETSFDRNVVWTKGNETFNCTLQRSRKTLNDQYSAFHLRPSGCLPFPK